MTIKRTKTGIEYRDDAQLLVTPDPNQQTAIRLGMVAGILGSFIAWLVVDCALLAAMGLGYIGFDWFALIWLPLLILGVYWAGIAYDLLKITQLVTFATKESLRTYADRAQQAADMYADALEHPIEPMARVVEERPIIVNKPAPDMEPSKPKALPRPAPKALPATATRFEHSIPADTSWIDEIRGVPVAGAEPVEIRPETQAAPPVKQIRHVMTSEGPVDARDVATFAKEMFVHGTGQAVWVKRFAGNHSQMRPRDVHDRIKGLFVELGILAKGTGKTSPYKIQFDNYQELSAHLERSGLIRVET